MEFARIVLKPDVTAAEVHQVGARTKEWHQVAFTLVTRDKPYTKTWESKDGLTRIKYLQGPLREMHYFHLTGTNLVPHIENIQYRLAKCNDRRGIFSPEEIEALARAAMTPTEKVAAVYRIAAAAAVQPDPFGLVYLTESLTDAAEEVRRAAVDASLVAFWPDLRGPLERVADADPEPDVRNFARDTLDTLRARVWDAAPGTFDFEPLLADPRRVKPFLGIGAKWTEGLAPLSPSPRQPKKKQPATETKVKAGTWGFFVFDFREHQEDLLALRKPESEIVQIVSTWDWEPQGTGGPDDYPSHFLDDENDLSTVAMLREHVKEQIPWPDEAVAVVFDKLRLLMKRGGWRFVGGAYGEFEGNRHNTEIRAILEKL